MYIFVIKRYKAINWANLWNFCEIGKSMIKMCIMTKVIKRKWFLKSWSHQWIYKPPEVWKYVCLVTWSKFAYNEFSFFTWKVWWLIGFSKNQINIFIEASNEWDIQHEKILCLLAINLQLPVGCLQNSRCAAKFCKQ